MKSTLLTIAENTGKSTGKTCALAISECALFSAVLLSNMYMAFQAKNGVRNSTNHHLHGYEEEKNSMQRRHKGCTMIQALWLQLLAKRHISEKSSLYP